MALSEHSVIKIVFNGAVSRQYTSRQWIGIVDTALASHSWGQGSSPAETRG